MNPLVLERNDYTRAMSSDVLVRRPNAAHRLNNLRLGDVQVVLAESRAQVRTGLKGALAEAGLQTDAGDMNFNLRGEDAQDQDGKAPSRGVDFAEDDMDILDENIIEEAVLASDGRVLTNGRIDIRA